MSPAKLSLSMVASPHSPASVSPGEGIVTPKKPATAVPVPAADEVVVVYELVPACDRAPYGSLLVDLEAYRAASRNRSHCVGERGCNDPRSSESSVGHLPGLAV